MLTVALVGNPNVGKTELFNRLTGMRQHVGNWPGVTVEKKVGRCVHKGEEMLIVDLPGIYSLTAHAVDELIARNYIVEEKPDVVIDIVDATNLERNLYLTLLLLELEANVVVALNMWDVVRERGIQIDVRRLSEFLGCEVVPTVATTGEGISALKDAVLNAAREKNRRRKVVFSYGREIEGLIKQVEEALRRDERLSAKYPTRWFAIKVLERDEWALKKLEDSPAKDEVLRAAGVGVGAGSGVEG